MDYIRLSFPITGDAREILVARLSEAGCEAFEETDDLLLGFLPADDYSAAIIDGITAEAATTYTLARIPQQNWNAAWESSFEPVVVPGFCTVRAAFHEAPGDTPHDIIITPKMSFGTGHHATTRLMMQAMRDMDFAGERVLDFGTGTGILAILAAKLGAADVLAIDNDEWSITNAAENIAANGIANVRAVQGSLEAATAAAPFDAILANINRHILVQEMAAMRALLINDGDLLLSGILAADEEAITEAATGADLVKETTFREGDWIAMKFNALPEGLAAGS